MDSFVESLVLNKFAQRCNIFNPEHFSCKWYAAEFLPISVWIFHVLIKGLTSNISASFKVLKHININNRKPTVFSLLFLHYEWHHITLGCWVMIREQCCWFDELCMKGLLSTLPSFSHSKAHLLRAVLMCAFVRPLCGPFWLSKLQFHKFEIHFSKRWLYTVTADCMSIGADF